MEEPCEARIAAPLPRAVFSLKVTPSMATVHCFARIAPSWFSENNVWRTSTWSELWQVKPRPMFCENVQLIRDADLRETRVRSWGILNNSHFASPMHPFFHSVMRRRKKGGAGFGTGSDSHIPCKCSPYKWFLDTSLEVISNWLSWKFNPATLLPTIAD